MQMGQSTTSGGQIKVQGPKGSVQRLFKGANGTRVGTGSGKSNGLDEGQWHVVKCVHTATRDVRRTCRVAGGTGACSRAGTARSSPGPQAPSPRTPTLR